MLETKCFDELNLFGENGGPSPDLQMETAELYAGSSKRHKSGNIFSRIFRKSRSRDAESQTYSISRCSEENS